MLQGGHLFLADHRCLFQIWIGFRLQLRRSLILIFATDHRVRFATFHRARFNPFERSWSRVHCLLQCTASSILVPGVSRRFLRGFAGRRVLHFRRWVPRWLRVCVFFETAPMTSILPPVEHRYDSTENEPGVAAMITITRRWSLLSWTWTNSSKLSALSAAPTWSPRVRIRPATMTSTGPAKFGNVNRNGTHRYGLAALRSFVKYLTNDWKNYRDTISLWLKTIVQ